jgi:hypothetical protein
MYDPKQKKTVWRVWPVKPKPASKSSYPVPEEKVVEVPLGQIKGGEFHEGQEHGRPATSAPFKPVGWEDVAKSFIPQLSHVDFSTIAWTKEGLDLVARIGAVRKLVECNAPNAVEEAEKLNNAIAAHLESTGPTASPSSAAVGKTVTATAAADSTPVPARPSQWADRLGCLVVGLLILGAATFVYRQLVAVFHGGASGVASSRSTPSTNGTVAAAKGIGAVTRSDRWNKALSALADAPKHERDEWTALLGAKYAVPTNIVAGVLADYDARHNTSGMLMDAVLSGKEVRQPSYDYQGTVSELARKYGIAESTVASIVLEYRRAEFVPADVQ